MNTNYRIRQATEEDQAVIREMIRRARIKPFNLDWPRFLLAETSSGTVVGCGQIKHHRDGSSELASIAVEKEWRHQGIASELIDRLLIEASGPIWLICQARLIGFYERFGFAVQDLSEEMPKHLRRAHRAVRLFNRLIPGIGEIAVMVRGGG